MKFSIITPTWNRADGRLERCMLSVQSQTFRDYEHIIIDDGSTDGTEAYVNLQGVIARNAGMQASTGDWLTWLDSDDALDQEYLATLAYNINQSPDVRLWVLGVIYHGMTKDASGRHVCPKWTKLRHPWLPPLNCDGAHDHFPSGKIGTGMFVFHRECYQKIGPMPPWKNHNQIADGVDEWLGYETGYSSAKRLCGNPHGDDWTFIRHLSMYYRIHLIHACLYIQYVR
jgi:glycosyltransferase involved in cell wall biosynthesis